MSTYVDLFMCIEIIKENGSWSRQCCQICYRVEFVNHDIG